METRTSRKHASPSISSVSGSDRRSISPLPKRGPSTPMKSSTQRNHSEDEQDSLLLINDSKTMINQPSSPTMSDTEDNHLKKRSHHRHRHHHHHHKQPKSNKRPAAHPKHSVKRRY